MLEVAYTEHVDIRWLSSRIFRQSYYLLQTNGTTPPQWKGICEKSGKTRWITHCPLHLLDYEIQHQSHTRWPATRAYFRSGYATHISDVHLCQSGPNDHQGYDYARRKSNSYGSRTTYCRPRRGRRLRLLCKWCGCDGCLIKCCPGDHVIASNDLYGDPIALLPRYSSLMVSIFLSWIWPIYLCSSRLCARLPKWFGSRPHQSPTVS